MLHLVHYPFKGMDDMNNSFGENIYFVRLVVGYMV